MKIRGISIVAIAFFLISSCTNVYTWSDQTDGVDYSTFQTYMIDEQCSEYNPGINPINQQRIKNAVELELRDMGYKRSADADLNIKFFVKNETKFFYENCLPEYNRYGGGKMCIEKVYTYEEGTLVIDLIDVKNNLAVWHGGASGKSWDEMNDPKVKIREMVKAILKEYKSAKSNSGPAKSTDD